MPWYPIFRKRIGILGVAVWLCLCTGVQTWGQQAEPPKYSKEEIQSVIKTLEDPAAREQLVRQLEILAEAREEKNQESEVKTAASTLLQQLSTQVEAFTLAVMEVAGIITELPKGIDWLNNQVSVPENRSFWAEVLIHIGIVVVLGYIAFFLSRRFLKRPRRALRVNVAPRIWSKGLRLFGRLLLDLLPVAIFAAGVYLTLGLISPLQKTRLVVLTWINAFIINHLVIILSRMIFAATAPGLRLSQLTDESAHYFEIWTKRLSGLVIYGYSALQVALLLGISASFYEVLLRVLGLVIAAMLIVLVLQNRREVNNYLRHLGNQDRNAERPLVRHTLEQLGRLWHILATLYIILFYGVWALRIPGGALFLLKGSALSFLALAAGIALLRGERALLARGLRISEDLKERFPRLEERANRYLHLVHKTIRLVIMVLVALAILKAWGVASFAWLASQPGQILVKTLLTIGGILLLALVAWEAANAYIESYLDAKTDDGAAQLYSARTRTLMSVIRKALMIVLIAVTSLMILSELGVNIGPLLAGAGVLGLAIGFGSQKLVQDVITGVFILLEDQISEGDVVNVGGKGGLVEAVSLRTLRLRDLSGTVHTIPYSAIDSVSNLTKEFSFYVFEVGIAYRENVDEVMEVLRQIGADLQQDAEYGPKILEPLEVLGVDAFADSAVVIKARIKTIPIKQWWVGREFNRRMKKKFDELEIEIPFPHQTLYFGVDKNQTAPPANIRVLSQRAEEALRESEKTEAPTATELSQEPAPEEKSENEAKGEP